MVFLDDVAPPIREISFLGYAAVAVHSLLFESAHRERSFKRAVGGQSQLTEGTSYWSHKAIAQTLKRRKATALNAVGALIDNRYIQFIGYSRPTTGSLQPVYQLIHPWHVADHRKALEIIGGRPSERLKTKDEYAKKRIKASIDADYTEEFEVNRDYDNADIKLTGATEKSFPTLQV